MGISYNDINVLVKKSKNFIDARVKIRPRIGIILGSGLGDFADIFSSKTTIDAKSIPNYPRSSIEGHRGKLVYGKIDSVPLLAFQGRVHYYETGKLENVLYPVHLAYNLGIKTLIVTNAAGGINPSLIPGDLMLIKDQINLTFENPISGFQYSVKSAPLYTPGLIELVRKIANKLNITINEGVYCGVKGPSYETSAEIEMIRRIGGDAVGMSTVNEVSLAHAFGMKILGISCITNYATGIKDLKLSHTEVTEVANKVKEKFGKLLTSIVRSVGKGYK